MSRDDSSSDVEPTESEPDAKVDAHAASNVEAGDEQPGEDVEPPPEHDEPPPEDLEQPVVNETGAHPRYPREPKQLPEDLIALPTGGTTAKSKGKVPHRIRQRVQHMVRRVERRADETEQRRDRTVAYAMRISMQVLRQWARDRCPQQAASLAFQTVLSIVPLVAVTLAVLRATGSMGAESSFVHFLATQFVPISPGEISKYLLTWSSHVTFKSLGIVGLISTVLLAFVIINSAEKVINHIWRAERKRSMPQKFFVFYTTATIAPFLLGTWLYQGASVGWTTGIAGFFLSSGTSFVALFLANYFLPVCRVRASSALVGAVVSTILFEIAKAIFTHYVYEYAFERYTGIYGAVAIVPLWLLWIYYSWLTFLLGVEFAHAAENLHLLDRVDRRQTMSLENELLSRVNGMTAARLMVEVCRAYSAGEKAVPRERLEHTFDLSPDALTRLIRRLKDSDLLLEVHGDVDGYLPAIPPSEITLSTVLNVFRGDDVRPDGQAGKTVSPLDKVLKQIDADARARTARLTLDQLL